MPKTDPDALLDNHTSGYVHSYVGPLLSCATLILEEYIQYFPNKRDCPLKLFSDVIIYIQCIASDLSAQERPYLELKIARYI